MVGTTEAVVMIVCSFVICLCFFCAVYICISQTVKFIKSAATSPPIRVEEECCYICVDRAADAANDRGTCGHGKMMCATCFETVKNGVDPRCPLCRAKMMTCAQTVNE
jgi:hypothetical protein